MAPRKRSRFGISNEPSSSNAFLVEAQTEEKLRLLDVELATLEDGTHPELVKRLEHLAAKYERDCEMLNVSIDWKREDFEKEFSTDDTTLREELKAREHELLEQMLNDCDERKRQIEKDSNCDYVILNGSVAQFPISKKSLRRRGHDITPDKRKLAKTPGTVVHLLNEGDIAHDVRDINKALPRDEMPKTYIQTEFLDTKRIKKVNVDSQRVTIDGKMFYRGQNLVVETANYGRFSALLQTIVEKVVHFRSTLPGDTRSVMATQDDLECGRVVVKKRT